ncbi:MAG: FAD-dependent oxidoreductase [Legionella sp.]|nr:FAD-dependent oxidoreductase [Legionella sp.]
MSKKISETSSKKPTLAIIGGGISGLSAAHCLQDAYDITLFEASSDLGGNNHSTTIDASIRAPMGVILFPGKPLFKNTLRFAEKFSLPLVNKQVEHRFLYQGNMQYTSYWRRWAENIDFKHVPTNIKDIWYLMQQFQDETINHDTTVGAWIKDAKLSEPCIRYFLLPAAALYLSMPYQDLFDLPVSVIARWWGKYFMSIKGLTQYSTIDGGNHLLIDAFVKHTPVTYLTHTPVIQIERDDNSIHIITANQQFTADKLVMATRPDEALKLLNNPTKLEKKLLSAITMGDIMSTLHRRPYGCHDEAMTLQLYGDALSEQHVVTTWNQEHFSGQTARPSRYVSIHEVNKHPIEQQDIEHQIKFRIPLPTASTFSVEEPIGLLNKSALNTYYCGSYSNAFFYHEDAIISAIKLTEAMGLSHNFREQL